MRRFSFPAFFCFFLMAIGGLSAQEAENPAAFIGMSLEELIGAFGVPESVKAVRGAESWQDDVVFVYPGGDVYILRDRVWQLGLRSAYGITLGDKADTVGLLFGDAAELRDGFFLVDLPPRSWPMRLRINLDEKNLVSALFVYRSDL